MTNEQETYSEQWNKSSEYLYENGAYSWMCSKIKQYKVILEIGAGTGQGTLSLLDNGHKVISIEKNKFCINKAKELLSSKGYKIGSVESNLKYCDVIFLEKDILDDQLSNYLNNLTFDSVICWNVGSYWNKEMIEFYVPYMIEYGLTPEQIYSNCESSYAELIIWKACKIASENNVPIHLIERALEKVSKGTDDYYTSLRDEFNFSEIEYDDKQIQSLSEGGRVLSFHGKKCTDKVLTLYANSILIK